MPDPATTLPILTERTAESALTHWGLTGTAHPLPGERDRNFAVQTATGERFLLKFCADGAPGHLALQAAALNHLAATDVASFVPAIVPTEVGSDLANVAINGEEHRARLTTWLSGEPLAHWRPRPLSLLRDVGSKLGQLTRALTTFQHPAARRELKWDLAGAGWIRDHTGRLADKAVRQAVERCVEDFDARLAPSLAACRRSIVHNDANDHNLLVTADVRGEAHVSGVIDFGDLVETHTVCDLAIALAYAMMDTPDPLSAGAEVVAGYHRGFPLEEREIGLLWGLARMRLAVSLVNAALERDVQPDNEYLQVSNASAARLLVHSADVHERLATYAFRAACGLEPCPASPHLRAWLAANRAAFEPLVAGRPLDGEGVYVHDFSVTSPDIGTTDVWTDQERFTRHVQAVRRDGGATIGLARYDEVRAIYTSDLFRTTGHDGPEWRTVHLGIDVDLPPGTPVCAPIAATVHSVRDNTTPGDYGPTVVLEHRVADGALTFWTLYGHLDREVLARLKPGDGVAAGSVVGHIGDRDVNGGWWPHVHVQVIGDILGREGDFTGVARPVEREIWLSISPDPSDFLRAPASARAPRASDTEEMRSHRSDRIGPSLSVSYRKPVHAARGLMQYLIDIDGRRLLDCVNNVAHVGHEHQDVVKAGQRQMAVLNTNTRYLHGLLGEYAERLAATLPAELSVCYLVNSGSEANELALRLAHAYTGSRDTIVLSGGYHGNTTTLVDISSYKFDGPGGAGAPDWVRVVSAPDTYRGPHRAGVHDVGARYADYVRDAVSDVLARGHRPAAFLAESVLSCAGQVVLPDGYLAAAYEHVRGAGGVCIADEVQVGLGRVGTHTWAFETQGVVPDIVTMGKPIGNGHPLGAVVTTPAIAAAFNNGMEYFNTFGGNPVSCAIGLAVLDVVERDGLRENAHRVGAHLMSRLGELAEKHSLIGDVRGLGLFIGVELVSDRTSRMPAPRQAGYVANRMRERAVLVSTDGPDNNVLKIKPPLCFAESDADVLAATLDDVLCESPSQP